MKTIVILGSARSDGHTRRIVDQIIEIKPNFDFVDLNDKEIGYFDYSHRNMGDDFLPLAKNILEYDFILFVTPVYWYSMSAIMKTFFDRLSDLLTIRKDMGKKLGGKSMGSISCGSPGALDSSFYIPFRETAKYLGMNYTGHVHTWTGKDAIPIEVVNRISEYLAETTGVTASE
ncbi:MAG: NAD(P)H-dependent oxidoreductase [Saprospiraceae bacterium]|nr:NAD(P)H-dependent oxidoreductase [Saprospiraceae bacterium]